MPEILIKDFSGGWTPCVDPLTGPKNGLLTMDNMELDATGALTLQGGTSVRQDYSSAMITQGQKAHTLFNRLINGTLHDYLADTTGIIWRDATQIGIGGDSTNAAFGTAFNYTLIASGNKRVKDSGSGSTLNLGILPPTQTPTVGGGTASAKVEVGAILPLSGLKLLGISTNYSDATSITLQTVANYSAVVQSLPGIGPFNCNTFGGSGTSTPDDIITLTGSLQYPVSDPDTLRPLQIDILLVPPDSAGNQVSDYYTYTVPNLLAVSTNPTQSGLVIVANFSVTIPRRSFIRVGTGAQAWDTVYGFRLTYTSPVSAGADLITYKAASSSTLIYMYGGSSTQTGDYQYAQINVNNTAGAYIAKSTLGPVSAVVTVSQSQILVTPQDPRTIDPQCNEAWVYRKGGNLDQWYRVLVFTNATGYTTPTLDTLSDQDALTLNLKVNLNLISVNSTALPDKIYDIIGPVNGRWYYFTEKFMYPSDINDPDLVDASLGVRTCGNSSELFMWARFVNNGVVLVGTSIDIYSLSGTFATLADGSIDVTYLPLGVKYPPLTCDVATYGGSLFYLATSGWRVFSGSGQAAFTGDTNTSIVSPTLDRLYRGEICGAYAPPNLKILPRSTRFPVVVVKNKLWCFITGLSNPRVEVYDFIRRYWRPSVYALGDVSAATQTQDGQIIAFFNDKKFRTLDVQTSKLIDGSVKQIPLVDTMFFDGDTPRQRKDMSTLKFRGIATDPLLLFMSVDNVFGNGDVAGTTSVSATTTDFTFDISQISALKLIKDCLVSLNAGGDQVANFVINDISLTYDLRPEQRSFMRFQSVNYGTSARKRLYSIPFQIDTLGSDVTLTPVVDGAVQSALTLNCNRKESFDYQFASLGVSPLLGVDYEYLLHSASGLFEFFGFSEPRLLETYPPASLCYVIPVTNFNSAAKKRVRTWPFVLSSAVDSNEVTFMPLVDNIMIYPTKYILTSEKQTYRYYFTSDIFGVDYSGIFTSSQPFEVGAVLEPESVQVLPVAKQFDQIGPEEFFRYGKIVQFELRLLPVDGSSIPYTIYFEDFPNLTGTIAVQPDVDASYYIKVPKGTNGRIVRIELGPTTFDFHRFYMRIQVAKSGMVSELDWIQVG